MHLAAHVQLACCRSGLGAGELLLLYHLPGSRLHQGCCRVHGELLAAYAPALSGKANLAAYPRRRQADTCWTATHRTHQEYRQLALRESLPALGMLGLPLDQRCTLPAADVSATSWTSPRHWHSCSLVNNIIEQRGCFKRNPTKTAVSYTFSQADATPGLSALETAAAPVICTGTLVTWR